MFLGRGTWAQGLPLFFVLVVASLLPAQQIESPTALAIIDVVRQVATMTTMVCKEPLPAQFSAELESCNFEKGQRFVESLEQWVEFGVVQCGAYRMRSARVHIYNMVLIVRVGWGKAHTDELYYNEEPIQFSSARSGGVACFGVGRLRSGRRCLLPNWHLGPGRAPGCRPLAGPLCPLPERRGS